MSAFQYLALNAKGVEQKGVVEAESLKHARQVLREQGLIPLDVKNIKKTVLRFKFFKTSFLTVKELALITRQLATLLNAGLPIEEVLAAVKEQSEKPKTKSLLLSIRSKILEGHALASALREFPDAFNELYYSTVAAGEKSGHLDLVLQRLADYTEQQAKMRQKIQHALIYPSVMVCVALSIVGFLLEYVVPKMVTVYGNMGQSLPNMTLFLIHFSEILKNYGIYMLGMIGVAIFLFRHFIKKNLKFKTTFHRFILKIPLLGHAIKVANTGRFSRTFAILSAAGVAVIEAIQISSKLITNIVIRDTVQHAAQKVKEGVNIHQALKQTTFFPPMSIHLIASGEASGQLENMLERAANNQDNEISALIDTILALFEPAIILIMGAIVLFIVLAILLPIFQLDQLAG